MLSNTDRIPDRPGHYVECPEGQGCDIVGHKLYFRFESWAVSRGLYCDKKATRNTGKVITFVTNAFVCLILLNVSDAFGRKFVIIINSFIILICLTGAALFSNYLLKMFLVGVAFGCEGDFIPLYIFLMAESSRRLH